MSLIPQDSRRHTTDSGQEQRLEEGEFHHRRTKLDIAGQQGPADCGKSGRAAGNAENGRTQEAAVF